jgi:plasmid stabilization system protein ParE
LPEARTGDLPAAAPPLILRLDSDSHGETGVSEQGRPMIYFLLNEDERLIEIGMTDHMSIWLT